MKKSNDIKNGTEDFFAEAKKWEIDRQEMIEKSEKKAWRIATVSAIGGIIGVLSTVFISMRDLPPPTVLRVSDSTGIVDVVTTMGDAKTNYEEVVNKYFIQRYVRFRDAYSNTLAEEYYNSVGLMSSAAVNEQYAEEFNPKNPKSPLNVLGKYAAAKTKVKSTSFLSKQVALVRYIRCVERPGTKPVVTHWAATVSFKYLGTPMSEKDRAINPLGYQTTEWRKDPDSVTETSSENACD
ncbi:virB8 family protein [Janthinobacterium sp. FW305-128]|uniref:virB8 family protein n=1 Tax=Janthinobacterium sp. FW305-128 TaxID=2775055 RepID=UPI001E613565|nr:VirB8/TrbF family protein [Janthinobacterium sp. FW305-128]MCC7684723.1 virB8 family protein [Janthinobacterium sp. FW305-128]